MKGASSIRAAIRLLEADAKIIFDSNVIRTKGHPRCGTFDTDEFGLDAKKDFDERMRAAEGLRKLLGKGGRP